jgi:hypothetical protein
MRGCHVVGGRACKTTNLDPPLLKVEGQGGSDMDYGP